MRDDATISFEFKNYLRSHTRSGGAWTAHEKYIYIPLLPAHCSVGPSRHLCGFQQVWVEYKEKSYSWKPDYELRRYSRRRPRHREVRCVISSSCGVLQKSDQPRGLVKVDVFLRYDWEVVASMERLIWR